MRNIRTFIGEALIAHLKQIGLVTEKSVGGKCSDKENNIKRKQKA